MKSKIEAPINKWFRAGNALLAQGGPESLTIEALCQQTGLTKGSFYHHFKDRERYADALLSEWEAQATLEIVAQVNGEASAREKLRMLTRLSLSEVDVLLERRIRAWSLLDSRVHAIQERVDGARQQYMVELWTEILGDAERARVTARIMFTIFIGSQTILPAATKEELMSWYAQLEQFWSKR